MQTQNKMSIRMCPGLECKSKTLNELRIFEQDI